MGELIFRGGTIVTVDDHHRVVTGDLAIADGVIAAVGGSYTPAGHDYTIVDATGCVVMPGLVQAHVHTCQTLARGRADDRELLDWLHEVVWPYEGALTAGELTAAAELAIAELLLGGTTAILDMATVHHTDAVFAAAERLGIRATIGKAMMDAPDPAIPPGLRESTAASLAESDALADRWHGAAGGRLRYAYAPRFVLSCTDELLTEVGRRAAARGLGIHTHASENRGEIAAVAARFGKRNLEALHDLGVLGPRTGIAHCIHLDDAEVELLARPGTHVLALPELEPQAGVGRGGDPGADRPRASTVAIGADGAPCNNNLDGFLELRLAALLHKPRCGPARCRPPGAGAGDPGRRGGAGPGRRARRAHGRTAGRRDRGRPHRAPRGAGRAPAVGPGLRRAVQRRPPRRGRRPAGGARSHLAHRRRGRDQPVRHRRGARITSRRSTSCAARSSRRSATSSSASARPPRPSPARRGCGAGCSGCRWCRCGACASSPRSWTSASTSRAARRIR
jgi:5-methylthioadenosine/S-adenosylhomocysteine deaminase